MGNCWVPPNTALLEMAIQTGTVPALRTTFGEGYHLKLRRSFKWPATVTDGRRPTVKPLLLSNAAPDLYATADILRLLVRRCRSGVRNAKGMIRFL
ncbi:hypothetical protein BV898_09315 [Hypsibius exemplaris]|uniref:Uncharacterized protein n=1 Tax=Hypsibius exemplaris TaxID=2072580 RepID=A0A1W0WN74_HYPEX|nr:hypothetical protein BV898_09315 [Hypsibius exemplaris]